MVNEVRLIDANALEQFFLHESKRLRERLTELDDIDDKEEMDYILSFLPTVEWARKTVLSVSTIDPESLRPKGQWAVIEGEDWNEDVIYQCSECKEEFVSFEGTDLDKLWNYCPECGAKMEG